MERPLPSPALHHVRPAHQQDATDLVVVTDAEIQQARGYVDASRAASTRRAYASDWARFELWCRERATPALPASPALVAVHLSGLAAAGLAPSSIARALAAIGHHHRIARLIPPHRAEGGSVVGDVLSGIRRSHAGRTDRKQAADADIVMQLLWSIRGDDLAALRDRAIIAFGMALAARRSELVALDVADLAWQEKGLRVIIRHSKTDQEGAGAVAAIPEGRRLTPLAHLRTWLTVSGISRAERRLSCRQR